jgi:type III secretion protein O
MSIFQQLFRIREFREQRAQAVVVAEHAALRRATQAEDEASQELDRFRTLAQARENALFDDLQARTVQVRDIQEVRHEVGALRVREQGYVQGLEKCELERVKRSDALDAARVRHQQAERTRQKIAERLAMDRLEESARRERLEDLALEEVDLTRGEMRGG